MDEVGYFQRIHGAHLGNPSVLLLECGHEVLEPGAVRAGTRLCLACGRGEPRITVDEAYWMRWSESQDNCHRTPIN